MTTPTPKPPRVRLPIPGGLEIALKYDVNGQPAVVVLGYTSADPEFASLTDATAVATTFHNNARALMATSCTLVDITAREAVPEGATYSLALPASNRTGTAAGNLITAYATLLRWSTPTGGRSGKGRTFVPGFTTGGLNADGRTLSGVNLTAAQTLGTAMAGAPGFAVLSRTKGTASEVTGFSVSSIVGVQRRRLRD